MYGENNSKIDLAFEEVTNNRAIKEIEAAKKLLSRTFNCHGHFVKQERSFGLVKIEFFLLCMNRTTCFRKTRSNKVRFSCYEREGRKLQVNK
jgi:hypothetical protein